MLKLSMGLFGRAPSFCTVCGKQLTHKHKPKREWKHQGAAVRGLPF